MNRAPFTLILAALLQSAAFAQTSLSLVDYTWRSDGEAVELKLNVQGASARADLRPYLVGAGNTKGEARGTAVYPSTAPQTITLTVPVPPEKRWQTIPVRIDGVDGNRTAKLNLTPPKGDLYVLAVGVKTFGGPGSSFPDLEYTVNDAVQLDKILRAQEGRQYRAVKSFLLKEEQATRASVLEAMTQIRNAAGANDTVIALFSTHGVVDRGTYYTMLYRGDLRDTERTAITEAEIQDFYAGLRAQTLLLLDTCNSGRAVVGAGVNRSPTSRSAGRLIDALTSVGATKGTGNTKNGINEFRAFISAAGENQKSLEEPKLQHGLFTYAVLEALQGRFEEGAAQAANINTSLVRSEVTINTLQTYVVERVRRLSEQYADPTDPSTRHVPFTALLSNTFILSRLSAANVAVEFDDGAGGGGGRADAFTGPAPDPARGVFVNAQSGKDTNSGAESAPVLTLQQALERKVGDRVTFGPGEYALPEKALKLRPNMTLVGQNTVLRCVTDTGGGLEIPEGARIEGIQFSNCNLAVQIVGGAVDIDRSDFRNNGQAILVRGGRATVKDSRFSENGGGTSPAVMVLKAGTLTVERSHFEANDNEGIRSDGAAVLNLNGVRFVGNGRVKTNGTHITLNNGAQFTAQQLEFVGAAYSIAVFPQPSSLRLCGVNDQTRYKTYQVNGQCF